MVPILETIAQPDAVPQGLPERLCAENRIVVGSMVGTRRDTMKIEHDSFVYHDRMPGMLPKSPFPTILKPPSIAVALLR